MELNPVLEPGEGLRNNIWYVISSPTSELRPSARSAHSLVKNGENLLLLGGATPAGFCSDKILNFNTQTHKWIPSKSTYNFDIFEQLTVCRKNGQVFTIGGNFEKSNSKTDKNTPQTNSQNNKITNLSTLENLDFPHKNRSLHHGGCLLNDRFLIFFGGGIEQTQAVNDSNFYLIDLEKLNKISAFDQEIISQRQGHCIVPIDNQKCLIHGGMNGTEIFEDFYSFNIVTKEIINLHQKSVQRDGGLAGGDSAAGTRSGRATPSQTQIPLKRAAHSMASDLQTGILYLHGGLGENFVIYDDFWMYDSITNFWTNLSKSSEVALPTPRISHAMVVFDLQEYDHEIKKEEEEDAKPNISQDAKSLQGDNCELIELENWRAVNEGVLPENDTEAINLAKNNLASTSKNLDIKKYTKVVGVFGGMDAEANFYNDLMVWKIE